MTVTRLETPKRQPPAEKKQGYGRRLAQARIAAGFSQKGLMAKLGWPNDSNSRLSGYENETRQPTLEDFQRIADLCFVSPGWIAFGDQVVPEWQAELVTKYQTAEDAVRDFVASGLKLKHELPGRRNR